MITVLQILFVLAVIILVILLVFQPRRKEAFELPENTAELLNDYVLFYAELDEDGKKHFEEKLRRFLSAIKITGANAVVEDIDTILIGAAAIIPVYHIKDWEYINLREILLYPGNFNTDFEQHGSERLISGMVGTGHMQNVMILNKWELRQGFINAAGNRNTAIHEFVHLIDKMDGNLDGVPEILLERRHVEKWKALLDSTMEAIRHGQSDIDHYGATSAVECFAVISEYFFTKKERFKNYHPQLHEMMEKIFIRNYNNSN